MNITVLNVTVTTVPTAKGSYQMAEVAYKNNSFGGKVESKKVMSFGVTKDAFSVISVAQPGNIFEVEVKKNDKGYNDWMSVQPAASAAAGGSVPVSGAKTAPATTGAAANPRGFETPEERAKKQVYIVRQSSVANAVAALSTGAKAPLKKDDVLALAREFENYVFDVKSPGASGFDDLPDFPKEIFEDVNVN